MVMRVFAIENTGELMKFPRAVFRRTKPQKTMLQRIRSFLVPLEVAHYIFFLHAHLKRFTSSIIINLM